MRKIRIVKVNDFVLSLIVAAFGLYVIFGKNVIKGKVLSGQLAPAARADVYLWGVAAIFILLAVILLVRSLAFVKSDEKSKVERYKFNISWITVISFVATLVYLLLMELIGFLIPSLVFTAFLCFMYRLKEKAIDWKTDKKGVFKAVWVSLLLSAVSVIAIKIIFEEFLGIKFP